MSRFFGLSFSLTKVSISPTVSYMPEILSSISCIILVHLPSQVPVQVPNFRFSLVGVFLY